MEKILKGHQNSIQVFKKFLDDTPQTEIEKEMVLFLKEFPDFINMQTAFNQGWTLLYSLVYGRRQKTLQKIFNHEIKDPNDFYNENEKKNVLLFDINVVNLDGENILFAATRTFNIKLGKDIVDA